MDIVRKPWTPLISDRFVMRNVSRFATPAAIVIVAVLVELWHRVTPDKPRMQIEISSWERWMMRPVINGPRDIPPVGFLYSGAFHARHLLDFSPFLFPFFLFELSTLVSRISKRERRSVGYSGRWDIFHREFLFHRDECLSVLLNI